MKLTGIERLKQLHNKTKKLPALSKYCIYCITFFTLYTIAELVSSKITGVTNDALTDAVKFFCTGEVFFCAALKWLKIKKEDKE